ncbi:MAG: LacI family DNA-binding transcriptional regulator [Prolixibacteraceae bacterium]|jgi:LacI family transcriptional regulator|nr:LacI family DNA-binding transcriptional regulator [Prolixibacteraceae bacterium]MDI9563957.1 LacI family DNA-binding transcriptional regulator [Bacteroidota bacterium]NLS98385.1 LacI family transcriptional regulator [Bacteroidales bacterium]OQB82206.1 MAG: Catabolite control protein A [Bacteroidetes bacterium ADurb.Bin123]HNZ69837.1 LacI family DNA-binding transcriptional regulator [Prolixibacteraceae bacterium]
MIKGGQVTIKDMARILGVAPSTVSRALQGHPDISAETRRLVNELAVRLKYQPNVVAQGLKFRRSNTIGVIIPEIVHYFFSQVISGIEEVAYKAGYTVIFCQSNERYDREVNNVKTLIAHRVDGILVSVSKETRDFQHLADILENQIPLVFFDRAAPGITADMVVTNDREAACMATLHLAGQGKKRIAHFAAPQNLFIGMERKAGYLDGLVLAGLTPDPALCVEADSFEKACHEISRMKASGTFPDAIFGANDLTAIGAMKSLLREGFRIPEEVAVTGFSDSRFAEIAEPSLTSVDQHGFEMGTLATQTLLKRIESADREYPCDTIIVKADLIIRNSSVCSKGVEPGAGHQAC